MERHLAPRVTHLRSEVMTMRAMKPLSNQQAEPWNNGSSGFRAYSATRREKSTNASWRMSAASRRPLQTPIHAQANHLSQARTVMFPHPSKRFRIRRPFGNQWKTLACGLGH